MLNFRAIQSNPVLVVATALFVWWFSYLVFQATPYLVHSLGKSSVARVCNAIKPGMTLDQVSQAMHDRYMHEDETYSHSQVIFTGQESTCVVDLTEKDQRVVSTHVRPAINFWLLVD